MRKSCLQGRTHCEHYSFPSKSTIDIALIKPSECIRLFNVQLVFVLRKDICYHPILSTGKDAGYSRQTGSVDMDPGCDALRADDCPGEMAAGFVCVTIRVLPVPVLHTGDVGCNLSVVKMSI